MANGQKVKAGKHRQQALSSCTPTIQKYNAYKVNTKQNKIENENNLAKGQKDNKIENENNLTNGQKVKAINHRQQALASCTPTIQKYNTYKVNAKHNKIENENNLAKGQKGKRAKGQTVRAEKHRQQALASCKIAIHSQTPYKNAMHTK